MSLKKKVSKVILKKGQLLDDVLQQLLCESFTEDDVKNALLDIDDNKSPGPNGHIRMLFKKAWPCIGGDVSIVILNFFESKKLLKQVHAINICLIPIIEQPSDVTQFPSIAYRNVL